jgi:predicted O-methyltransferase YrrM
LLDLSAMLAVVTPDINHPILSTRSGGDRQFYAQFPGEHYHLLTAICGLLKPAIVWEFGTDTGMSTVAMLEGLRPESKLYTVDINGWRSKTGPWLVERDIGSGRVTQLVCDMKCETLFTDHLESISQAELIFVDGPKDGSTEGAFLLLLEQVSFRQNPIVIFDDIRLINMVGIWRGIQRPKMDMTSYGHWSGTGLVDWLPSSSQNSLNSKVISDRKTAKKSGSMVVSSSEIENILVLCHQKPNYIPDLLLHGLRKLVLRCLVWAETFYAGSCRSSFPASR